MRKIAVSKIMGNLRGRKDIIQKKGQCDGVIVVDEPVVIVGKLGPSFISSQLGPALSFERVRFEKSAAT